MRIQRRYLGLPGSVVRRILCRRAFLLLCRLGLIVSTVTCAFIMFFHSYLPIPEGSSFHEVVERKLAQDDPRLVRYIQQSSEFLVPPSGLAYNLSEPGTMDPSTMDIGLLIDHLFHNKVGGTFFEAGAYDGEHESQTLYLERYRNWTGVLAEASPKLQKQLLGRNRKSTFIKACVSPHPRAVEVAFLDNGRMTASIDGYLQIMRTRMHFVCGNGLMDVRKVDYPYMKDHLIKHKCKEVTTTDMLIEVKCLPLYTMLLAARIDSLDFLSLDIEGAELGVIETIPFHKVDIKLIRVEVTVMPHDDAEKVMDILLAAGYERLTGYKQFHATNITDEYIFIKKKYLQQM